MTKKTQQTFRSGPIEHFSERLREAINGESNTSFAKKCGLSETVIRNYLSGKTYPGIDKLPAIAAASGRTVEWLINGVDKSDTPPLIEGSNLSEEELREWWEIILRSLTMQELACIVESFKNGGKTAIFTEASREAKNLESVLKCDSIGCNAAAASTHDESLDRKKVG